MHTLNENYKGLVLLRPESITATKTGTGIDVEQYEDDCMVVLNYGALGGTNETFDAKVEISYDGTNYEATAGLTFGQVTGSNGDNTTACGRVSLKGVKKIRGVVTMSGTSASLVSMVALVRAMVGGASVNSSTPA